MNKKLRQQLAKRKRRLDRRIDKAYGFSQSGIRGGKVKLELAEKQQAVSASGVALILEMIEKLKLRKHIRRRVQVLKLHAPYDETDHILNIALNLLAGGTCLEHLEHRRTDEAYLNLLGSQRIPDPTTAGDFCRRFSQFDSVKVMQAINESRQIVWKQQDDSFFDQTTLEADGTMVETAGQKKEGIGINHKSQWGYHPLVVSLAETQEVLYLAIKQCREAGFRKIVLRGDTDFSQTQHLDRWHEDKVQFVFGYDAAPNLVKIADSLDKMQFKPLTRDARHSSKPRHRRDNTREEIVVEKGYKNLVLAKESYAEFDYRPTQCSRCYRMVVVRKEIHCHSGQQRLFDDDQIRYFFYITNESKKALPAREVIRGVNRRCNQENTIAPLKACHCLKAPLHDLASNGAYMVFAALAWNLKQWSGMLVRVKGNPGQRRVRGELRRWLVRMEFATYLSSLILIPGQVIRSARTLKVRLLTYRPSVEKFLMLHDHIGLPLRH